MGTILLLLKAWVTGGGFVHGGTLQNDYKKTGISWVVPAPSNCGK